MVDYLTKQTYRAGAYLRLSIEDKKGNVESISIANQRAFIKEYALKNNIEIDVKVKCVEEQITQAELAEKSGTSPSYVNRLIKSPEKIINKTFIQMMEQLGYDVELTYVKK